MAQSTLGGPQSITWGIDMLVYLATNTVNGMRYVGLTRRSTLEPRISEHFANARNSKKGSNKTLAHAIRVYGEDAFSFEILDRLNTLQELSRAERYWIQNLKTRHPIGYNIMTGGCPTFQLAAGDIYEIDGKKYYGCGDLAEHFPVSVHNIRHRILRAGWTVRQAVGLDEPPEKKSDCGKPIRISGLKFTSIKEACEHFGISENAYHSRRRYGWSDKEAFEITAREKPYKRADTQIIVSGRKFRSVSKAAQHYGLRPGCVTQRLRNGWTTEQAFGLSERDAHPNCKMFAGYKSISDAARQTGINQSTISWRLKKGWSPEQALSIAPIWGNNQSTRI